MKTVSTCVFLGALIVVVGAGAGALRCKHVAILERAKATSTDEPSFLADTAPGLQVVEAAAARTRGLQREALRAVRTVAPMTALASEATHRHSTETLRAVDDAVIDMVATRGLFDSASSRQRILGEILRSPTKLAVFEDVLASEAFARTTFGERQADARYFASMTLQEAAKDGNDGPLLRADHWFHLENAFCYADLGYARDIVHPACITKALSMG